MRFPKNGKERRISFPGGRTKIFLATQSSLAHEEEKTFCLKKEKVLNKILKELAVIAPDLLFSQLYVVLGYGKMRVLLLFPCTRSPLPLPQSYDRR